MLLGLLGYLPALAAALTSLIACLVLAGWLLEVELAVRLVSWAPATTITTALLLLGTAAALALNAHPDRIARRLRHLALLPVTGAALYALGHHLFGWSLEPLALLPAALSLPPTPGVMLPSPQTAIGVLLLCAGIALNSGDGENRRIAAGQLMAIFATLVAIQSLAGYLHRSESFFSLTTEVGISPITILGLLLLGSGSAAINHHRGLMGLFCGAGIGSATLRRITPLALLIPLLIGWSTYRGFAAGWYDPNFLITLATIANLLFFSFLLWPLARRLNRQQAEALRGERFRNLFRLARDELYLLTGAGRIQEVNRHASHNLGYAGDELLGQEYFGFVHDLPETSQATGFADLLRPAFDDEAITRQGRHRCKDGDSYPVEIVVSTIRHDGGELLLVSARDIGERLRHQQALQDHNARLQALLDGAVDGIVTIDQQGIIESVNPAMERLFGYSATEMVGQNVAMLTSPPHDEEHDRHLERYLTTGEPRIIGIGREVIARHRDGSLFPIELGVSETRLSDHRIFTGFIRDISTRKAWEAALTRTVEKLAEANRKLERRANQDGLTGIANRRRFDEYLRAEWLRARRDHLPLTLAMVDVDHFKAYNDRYGHQQGDEVLRRVAAAMEELTRRPADLAARYGGEEFALILPETTLEGGRHQAELLRARIEALAIEHAGSSAAAMVTVSIGVASILPAAGEEEPQSLIVAADDALYTAKEMGRNRVVGVDGRGSAGEAEG